MDALGTRNACISQVASVATVKRIWMVQTHPTDLHGLTGVDGGFVSVGVMLHPALQCRVIGYLDTEITTASQENLAGTRLYLEPSLTPQLSHQAVAFFNDVLQTLKRIETAVLPINQFLFLLLGTAFPILSHPF